MANTIKIKRSTGSAAPTSLAFGELAYSSGSGKLYFGSSTEENGANPVVTAIGGAFYADLLGATPGTAAASKAVVLDAQKDITGLRNVTATSFTGALTGNASTATKLETARTINGVNFDGSANISFGTDAVSEGTTNLYFTNERVDDRVADLIVAGNNITKTYDDVAGTLTIAATTNEAAVRALFSATDAGGDGSFSYNSSTGVFTYTGPSASEVRAHFSGGTGVTITDGVVAIGQAVSTTSNVTFNNVTVDGTLSSNDITAANISIDGAATVTGALTVTGNLTVNGTTTTVNSTTLEVTDKNITVAKGAVDAAAANGAGLTVEGPATPATLTYASADDSWNFNKQVKANVTGALTGNADTATTLKDSRNFSVSGDASTASAVSFNGSGNVDLAVTLATVLDGTTNKVPGSFGSSTAVPVVTVDAKGRVTAITTSSISTTLNIAGNTGTDSVALATDTLTVDGSGAISTAASADKITISVADATTSVKGVASFDSGNFAVTSGAVTIKAGGVTATELAADAVETAKIKDSAVTTDKIANGAVTNVKLANSSVTISDGTATDAVALGETLTVSGSGAISTAVTANTVTVSVATATTSGTKGVASFNSEHFSITDGVVSTILDGGTY